MLSKEKCTQAINVWKETRADFLKVKTIISPTAVFHFTREDCDWIKENNKNSNFHAYAGVHKDKLILIIVPLNEKGKEIDLDKYLTTKLTDLKNEITLTETDVVTTVSKITLSRNLEVTNYRKEVDLPTYNEPIISEKTSVKEIEKWKNECLDWFYYECNEKGGKSIFRTFKIPFADLAREDKKQDEVIALFGFKESSFCQTQIPILVFVSITDEIGTAEFIRKNNNQVLFEANTRDWAHPCPPLCKEEADFTLLDTDE